MNKQHFDLIREYCEVLAEASNGIWYKDGDFKVADVYEEDEGWISYSCNNKEMFNELCEMSQR
jgi:hypothetical protein